MEKVMGVVESVRSWVGSRGEIFQILIGASRWAGCFGENYACSMTHTLQRISPGQSPGFASGRSATEWAGGQELVQPP
jgi:hypothetical protein